MKNAFRQAFDVRLHVALLRAKEEIEREQLEKMERKILEAPLGSPKR